MADRTVSVTMIKNAGLINGDGVSVVDRASICLEGNRVVWVGPDTPAGVRAHKIIDGRGRIVIPGIINSHAHGILFGAPLFSSAALPLSPSAVRQNLLRHISQGTTTLLNMDGFADPHHVEKTAQSARVNIKTGWSHYPSALEVAREKDGAGLGQSGDRAWLKQGELPPVIVAIGEAGSGATLGGGVTDYKYIPEVIMEKSGAAIDEDGARRLKEAVLGRQIDPAAFDPAETSEVLASLGLGGYSPEWAKDAVEQVVLPVFFKALEAVEAGATEARNRGLPLVAHTAPPSAAKISGLGLGPLLIAAHANHPSFERDEALSLARVLKKQGAFVDISTFDILKAPDRDRQLEIFFRFLEEDLADVVSTDYGGGDHSPILDVLKLAVEEGAVSLAKAISLITRGPSLAIPRLAPGRGLVKEGLVADLALVDQSDPARVTTLIVGGEIAFEEGRSPKVTDGRK